MLAQLGRQQCGITHALTINDSLINRDGQVYRVIDWQSQGISGDTYNLDVANAHTYFVGEQGIWVHNGPPCDPNKPIAGAGDSTLHERGYKAMPEERTFEGYVTSAAEQREIGLDTAASGFDFNASAVARKQFKRFGADSHAGLAPHVHQPQRNKTPKGPRGGTGTKTHDGGVTSPTKKYVKQIYDHLKNGKY